MAALVGLIVASYNTSKARTNPVTGQLRFRGL